MSWLKSQFSRLAFEPSVAMQLALGWMAASMAFYLFIISRWGFGTSPDSIVYIAGARNIAAGQGFTFPSMAGEPSPIVQFPPLFSATLAGLAALGIDPLDGSRILNTVLFALNVFMSGLLVYRATSRPTAGFIAAALIMTAPVILTTHAMVWSEALFLFLVLTTAFALERYLEAPTWSSLIRVLPAALLAPLVRYVGVAVVIAAAATIARKKFKHAVVFAAAGSLGIAAWLARNYFLSADFTGRKFFFHALTADQLQLASQTVLEWFGGLALAGVFAGLIMITFLRRPQDSGTPGGAPFLHEFGITYLFLLTISLFLADAHTPLDRRILSPLYISLALSALIWIVPNTSRTLRLVWALVLLLIVTLNVWSSITWLNVLSTQGFGFSSSFWRDSATMKYLKEHHATPLYTNAPDAVFLLVGTPAAMLPRQIDPDKRAANSQYETEMEQLRKNGGIVVYFRAVTWRWYLPAEDRLQSELGLSRIAELGDGAVYAIAPMSR